MSTIFITSFHPFISRNILQTKVLELAAATGGRIVILVPDYKREYFERNFAKGNIIIEGLKANQSTKFFLGLFFKRLHTNMLNTKTVKIQQKYKLWVEKKIFYYFFFLLPARLFGKSKRMVRLSRWLDYHFSPRGPFRSVIRAYGPDIIFSTDVQNENDVSLMQEARRQRIPIVGMVRSWDNLTVHGLLRILPDKLLVGSKLLKEEAIRYHYAEEKSVAVVGIPHYDRYLHGPTLSRREFFQKIGARLDKKLIVYIPIGDRYIKDNEVDRSILSLVAALDVNVLVRFPPADTADLDDFVPPPNVIFDQPGFSFAASRAGDREITEEDDRHLVNTLAHADVIIASGSTICIDAAVFDKPCIIVGFDALPRPAPYWASIERFLESNHVTSLISTRCCPVARSKEDLLRDIQLSFERPERTSQGRRRLLEKHCFRLDGNTSRRVADLLLLFLDHQTR